MQDKINEKLKEQKELMPDRAEFRTWLNQSDLWNWTYTAFKIKGEPLSKSVIVDMLDGKIREDLNLQSYAFCQSVQNVYKDMKNYIQMETQLTPEMIIRWSKMLLGFSASSYDNTVLRENDSLVYEWELIPPNHSMVLDLLKDICKKYNKNVSSPLLKASYLHLELNRIYAFGDDTPLVSMAVLMFSLLESGYNVPELPLDDREYNRLVAEYFESNDLSDFYSMLSRSIYNRHEKIVDLCKQAREISDWTRV